MQGKNELHLCQAEMVKAVQHYLDTVIFRPEYRVTVKSVEYETNSYEKGFVVNLEGVPETTWTVAALAGGAPASNAL